jgi:hypothetical protein
VHMNLTGREPNDILFCIFRAEPGQLSRYGAGRMMNQDLSPGEVKISLFSTAFRQPCAHPASYIIGTGRCFRAKREADHSPPSSAGVREGEAGA